MWVLLAVSHTWILLNSVKQFRYVSAHIPLIKQKIKAALFLLLNTERSHSILRI
jgi:thiosulfate reductase cytochrome b subunit